MGARACVDAQDMMTANDEIEMLRYRLRLHAPIAVKTIILESNLSHAGFPKPLYVRNALTDDEIRRYHVELINVPFPSDLRDRMRKCTNSTNTKCTWLLEVAQRRFIMDMLQPAINKTLESLSLDDVFVHMSDLDELLDVDAVMSMAANVSQKMPTGCVSPRLRNFVYGERCPASYPPWARSVLFRARSGWLERHMGPTLQLRKLAKGKSCDASTDWLGWHFGYFMPTARIIRKLENFAHAHDSFIRRITDGRDPMADMEHRIRNCLDVHGRRYGPAWAAYDGKLPRETGWPRNPMAPFTFNVSLLERELRMAEADVTRAAKRQGDIGLKRAWSAALGRRQSLRAAIAQATR